ncbi:MAG: FtsX-like permease family protein, partial [Deltaproteobacteria bacterium]|nr:FtsX-like permease family protein [Deltaproteobacteria bacterium]
NQVHVLGVDERFFKLSPVGDIPEGFENEKALINTALASRLKITQQNESEVVLRIDNPSAISRNLVLAPHKESTLSIRLFVSGVAADEHFGRFSLEANQQEPMNLFVPIAWLQRQINRDGRANLLLVENYSQISVEKLNEALKIAWRLEDAEADLLVRGESSLELSSSRVFIDESLTDAAYKARPDATGILTYFVNELRANDAYTPYSMVTAVERKGAFTAILPSDMKDDQIVINQWLAEDLNAKVGDQLTLRYFDPGRWQTLEESQRSFTICRIVPIEGAIADPGLTPDLPGLSDSENCSDWDPSLPIDLELIRDKDEKYWDDFHGTPKAIVTLAAGKSMWANTYGNLTALRFTEGLSELDNLTEKIKRSVDPASFGLSAIPVREIGMKASEGGTDFGHLFLGLSMFLIFSAILLTWLLFVFSIEEKKKQTGMLLAIGFPVKRIQKLYLYEGLLVALSGAVAGTFIAIIYTRLLVWGLSNAWQGAVAGMSVRYSVTNHSLATGSVTGFLIAVVAMIWTLRIQIKDSAHGLLSGAGSSHDISGLHTAKSLWPGRGLSIIFFACAMLLIIVSRSTGSITMSVAFFGAGALLLISIMTWMNSALAGLGLKSGISICSLNSLALQNSARRRGRSLAVIAMLACGVFMVVAVGVNRKDPGAGAERRESGTGGFSLYAESSVPVMQDLNSESGLDDWGMNPDILEETSFVSFMVRKGDDASCLNLNRTQEPRILAVSIDELAERKAFSFQDIVDMAYREKPWDILKRDYGKRVIPAVGDYPTVYWGLGKRTGDILTYHNRKGEEIRLVIAGMIRSSVLQGNLIISEKAMAQYFPEVEGYGTWLIDTPAAAKTKVSEHITQRMAYAGVSVQTAVERLEKFARMEETYLSIFLMLGGLGLMLGCTGLGLIVARNLIERQGEMAMMRAIGLSKNTLLKLVCYEHLYLLAAGIITGLICALISVIPAISAAKGQLPFNLLGVMILLIGISGAVWVVISTKVVLRGEILTSLRNE